MLNCHLGCHTVGFKPNWTYMSAAPCAHLWACSSQPTPCLHLQLSCICLGGINNGICILFLPCHEAPEKNWTFKYHVLADKACACLFHILFISPLHWPIRCCDIYQTPYVHVKDTNQSLPVHGLNCCVFTRLNCWQASLGVCFLCCCWWCRQCCAVWLWNMIWYYYLLVAVRVPGCLFLSTLKMLAVGVDCGLFSLNMFWNLIGYYVYLCFLFYE